MDKMLFTSDKLPQGMEVAEVYPMIQFTGTVEISDRGAVVGMYERKRTEEDDIIKHFAALASSDANAILGIQVSTSTHSFGDLAYLYITYVGTPALVVSE
ncbi:hypothetical protein PN836_014660 [Ningiella sp. W23]|uniref:hypothetical protein n=1 Tax=Ningiella sp. W23 TaxID=3023715 RepID=UPI003756BDE1